MCQYYKARFIALKGHDELCKCLLFPKKYAIWATKDAHRQLPPTVTPRIIYKPRDYM